MPRFTSNNQPKGRGKSFKTKLLESIRRNSLIEASPDMTPEETELLFMDHLANKALTEADNILLKEVLARSYSSLKSTLPYVEFEFDPYAKPSEQVTQLMDAASKGEISPDIAISFVNAVKAAVEIEQHTDLKERIEQLESLVN